MSPFSSPSQHTPNNNPTTSPIKVKSTPNKTTAAISNSKHSKTPRSHMKLQLLSLGYDLAAKALGYTSFTEMLNFAGDFSRAIQMLKTFQRGEGHKITVSMIKALVLGMYTKRFMSTGFGNNIRGGEDVLRHYKVGKKVKKWGRVYRRIWKVKRRMEKKVEKRIKEEEVDT